jgi:PEP-CTERM motif-containing protein
MKKRSLIIVAAVFALFLLNSNAIAGYLDTGWQNITKYDGLGTGTSTSNWYTANEDHEVEPGAATGQQWDMEGFYLSDGTGAAANDSLTMVGGYNFVTGVPGYPSGDLFIDTDMDTDYWEYVLDLNFDPADPGNSTYTVYENKASNPIVINPTYGGPSGTAGYAWTYGSGGDVVSYNGSSLENLALNYLTFQNDSQIGAGLTGGWHNIITADIAFLGANTGFQAWNTMRCGNDRLFSEGTTSAAVPEPATIFLLGSGLLGLFGFRKKLRKSDK